MRRLLAITIAAAALAGCGNARTQPPNVDDPLAPQGRKTLRLDGAGISFRAPANWEDLGSVGSLAGGVRSRTATVAMWRYPRTEPLPADRTELAAARDRLVGRIRAADPTFELDRQRLSRRGIVLLGRQTVAGVPVGIRSVHLFRHGAEVVVDAYAPPEDFDRVDSSVFQPLLETLELRAP